MKLKLKNIQEKFNEFNELFSIYILHIITNEWHCKKCLTNNNV